MAQDILERKMQAWLCEADTDVLGLWQLSRAARQEPAARTPEEVKAVVLAWVRQLLSYGVWAVEISDLKPWPDQTPNGVIARISREWDALGREPNVPDIVWFRRLK